MRSEFQRIAIVNRGEPAMRFIHAAREFNQENDAALRTIALYTEPDRHAMFVREADEAVLLGPAQVTDPRTKAVKCSYVDYGRLERALSAARAEAVWVGWGFVAEHAEFADLCRELGIVFIGPDGDVMRRLGDKIASKRLAEEAQIPVAGWSKDPVDTLDHARAIAEQLGYPLMIKATAGGGGHGIRRVNSAEDLAPAFESARSEAFKAFGDSTVFMEELVQAARHVEVQVIADHYGNVWAVGVRDCSIQRRHQKILEEAPSPALTPEQDRELREAAVRLARRAGYHNAGTVEFLYEPHGQRFAFMEMNTRLQVEHPVTERTTGVDLVKLQIHVARGGRLEGEAPRTVGHAIEVRLNAEDADNNFAPAPGGIERFRILSGPGVRVDTGVAEGDLVPAEFDSMIAKIIAYGQNRREALSRLERALRGSVVVVKNGASNKAFLLELLNHDDVKRGEVDIAWLDRLAASGRHISHRFANVALLQAAVEAYAEELAVERTQFYASAVRGRPQVREEIGRTVDLCYRGNSYSMRVCGLGPGRYRVEVDGARIEAHLERLGPYEYWLTAFGRRFHVVSVFGGLHCRIEVDGVEHRIDREDGGVLRSPSPAVVVSIRVKPGDKVSAGDSVAVLEAMKMEMQITAPFSGRVRQVMAIPNVQVSAGAPLVQIEAAGGRRAVSAERVTFLDRYDGAEQAEAADSGCLGSLEELRDLMLGFDVDPGRAARLREDWAQFCALPNNGAEIRKREDEILSIFVDICSLFHRQPEVAGSGAGETPSAESHLFLYLRTLDKRGDDLPAPFIAALKRALAHYGIDSLERSPALEESLLWIYRSHTRMEHQIAPIMALLERRLERTEALATQADEPFRTLLDRMVLVTSGSFPAVSDLAREVRYRYFDEPLFERARREVYAGAEAHLAALAADPHASDRRERIRSLVECPQPLASLLIGRFAGAGRPLRRLMLEALAQRYYRIRALRDFRHIGAGGHCFASAEYDLEGKTIRLFAANVEFSRLEETCQAMFPLLEGVPSDHDIAIDFYAWHSGEGAGPEATHQEIAAKLNSAGFPRALRRIVVVVAEAGAAPGANAQVFTYRPPAGEYKPGESLYIEDAIYRGVHPMVAKRLHFWRLANFNIERLPSVEDVYLLRAVGKENPKDERLIACAEVRDMTPVRDEAGRVIALPHLERMFGEAAAAMRTAQWRRSAQQRLCWNRILLYVRPPLTLQPEESNYIVNKLAPMIDGLGLERVVVRARIPHPATGELRDMVVRISNPAGAGIVMSFRSAASLQPMVPLAEYEQKVVRMRQRGFIYPYEIIRMLTPSSEHTRAGLPPGRFTEYDLDSEGRLAPVDRPYGLNKANIIVGLIRNVTPKYPEGIERVILLGDPSKGLGALAEPECRRIIAAIELAAEKKIPVEWFAISAGAKISMDSGVENMDWIAGVLRSIVTFTQAGGEVNVIIDGINVGAQPYWNAEATMLMHARGILIMTPKAAMVLTGKRALDYSGSVSAEDNFGIGGYDRIMGGNGQAQYFARDIYEAGKILMRHYDHAYVAPGERFPRSAPTSDLRDRDVCLFLHGDGFSRIGEIFNDATNPGRKKSFDIRRVMRAVSDQDHSPLERWAGMRAAEIAVVWDVYLGGHPVCLIGIESKPLARLGFVPADGPDQWTAGTLFPLSSKKVARAINAASNNRPVVILANLSGFDGSPDSMRNLQLEYGAEIGRAVVNFKGPMVFCVISRYHGGAYVVFSRALNENLEVSALEGAYASVIGGAPAAAVVFASEVEARTRRDPRLQELSKAMADPAEKARLRAQWDDLYKAIYSENLGEMAAEFDRVHCVQRALRVGALHRIVPPTDLRPYLIDAVERGMRKEDPASLPTRLVAGA